MNDLIYEFRNRRDGVKDPGIWVAVALSLLIHAAALWQWLPHLRLSWSEMAERGHPSGPLVVQLSAPATPPPAPPSSAALQEQRRAKPASRARLTPPVIALNQPTLVVPSPPRATESTAAPDPALAAAGGDLSSYLEARRRARGESATAATPSDSAAHAPPVESDNARASRIAAANIGSGRTPTFGHDPMGGGIFGIQRLHHDYAEFIFFGWNKDIRRNTSQLIEVRRGSDSDIRIAVIRRMIAIIREHEQEDFIWESKRLGRYLTLSARARDSAGLEDFLMREFFDYSRMP